MIVDCETETAGAFRQILHVAGHTLHADITVAAGGGGSAPGPHEYFDASLAACKALTAAVYAKSRNIALERVEVHVTRDDSKEREGTYKLSVKVAFHGGLSDAEKQKLHEVIQRCPIHKLMTSSTVEITSEPL
jgi:putative redox protein